MLKTGFITLISFSFLTIVFPHAQPTQAQRDSGWVALFNGINLNGFRVFDETNGWDNNIDSIFRVSGGKIVSPAANRIGFVITNASYSHYRARVEYQFPLLGTFSQNAGLLHHAQDTIPLFNNRWPASIECQGQKSGIGDGWAITLSLTTTVNSGTQTYNPNGTAVTVEGRLGLNRQIIGTTRNYRDGEWNTLELLVRGENFSHFANGVEVLRGTNVRRLPDVNSQKITRGKLALQQEFAHVEYRNFMVMELDPVTGEPLHRTVGFRKQISFSPETLKVGKNVLTVNFSNSHPTGHGMDDIRIIDTHGRTRWKGPFSRSFSVNIKDWNRGVYFMALSRNGHLENSHKFIIP